MLIALLLGAALGWNITGHPACFAPTVAFSQAVQAAGVDGTLYTPSAADASAAELLTEAKFALQQLDGVTEKQERHIMYSQAIAALTGLYQLHGCEWALAPLAELYQRADCPDLHLGYSADGRLVLRVERLVLKNPAYNQYALYLCTLEGNTSLNLEALEAGSLRFVLDDGRELAAETVNSSHPLWPHLKRLATTFVPTPALAAGNAHAFKQVFALSPGLPVPGAPNGRVQAVSLQWGRYSLEIPYFGNEVQLDR